LKIKIPNLFLALAWLALPTLVSAQFSFTTNNGIITITGYNTAAGLNVVIPAATNGFPVTSIGADAFEFKSITNVTIPNSVTSIGEDAFGYCDGLTNATIPNSVTNLGDFALGDCASLTSVTIGTGVTSIREGVFEYCTGLTNVTIGNSVTGIAYEAFEECYSLTSVTIPSNVTNIEGYAFGDCTSLANVTIPNSVTNIGDGAFGGCTSLKSAYFQGNAPPDNGDAFYNDPATVYYLPGSIGWDPTFGGVPAMLWNPQTHALSFTGAHFGFNLTGPTNAVIIVEASTNLAQPVWLPVATNTLSASGTSTFSDLQAGAHPTRFYRERSP